MRLNSALLLGLLVSMGCLETTAVECADGRVCPSGTVCDVVSATCVRPGGLVIDQAVLQLNEVECGTTSELAVSLGNFGDQPISFTASSTMDIVSISPSSGTIPPGSRLDVVLTADATATSLPVGQVEGAVYFTTETEIVPRIVQFTIAGAVIRTSEQTLDFGIASLSGLPAPRTFTIHNDGNAPVDVTVAPPERPFDHDRVGPITIGGDASTDVAVSFSPSFTGDYSSVVGLSFDGPVCQPPPTEIDLSGQISDAAVLVDTTIVDFGTTTCGADLATREVVFSSNAATEQTLTLTSIDADAANYDTPSDLVLGVGAQQTVAMGRDVVPVLSATGPSSATVTVTAQPSNVAFDIELRHEVDAPVLSVSPRQVDFGIVKPKEPAKASVSVTNSGTAPALVSVTPPVIQTPKGGTVKVEPSSFTLEEGATTSVDIIVDLEGTGFVTAGLMFNFDSPGQCSTKQAVSVQFAAIAPGEEIP